jgi:hypothetical protein
MVQQLCLGPGPLRMLDPLTPDPGPGAEVLRTPQKGAEREKTR